MRLRLPRRLKAGLFAAVAAAVAGGAAAQGGPRPALVGLDAARITPVAQTTPLIAQVVALRAGPVTASVSAPVKAVSAAIGDRVAAGAPLAALDDADLTFALRRADAAVALAEAARDRARADAALAGQELARLQRLRQSAAFNQARFEDAQSRAASANAARAQADADIARATAERDRAARAVEQTVIRAPYAGVVTAKHLSAGAYATPGAAVVSLLDDAALEIEAAAPYTQIEGLTPGVRLRVETPPKGEATAVVRAALPREDPLTRTRIVRMTPEWRAAPVAAGQSVVVHIPTGAPRDALTVAKDAILNGPGGTFVYVDDDGVAAIRPVRLGVAVGDRFEVIDGLAVGDRVVVRGNEGLSPGRPLKPSS